MKNRSDCQTPGCRGVITPNMIKRRKHFCAKCQSRRAKLSDPVGVAFQKLRARAGERGHAFTITLPYWRGWCFFHLPITGESRRHKDGISVDRIDGTKGYEPGNIRPVPLHMNSRLARMPVEVAMRYQFTL